MFCKILNKDKVLDVIDAPVYIHYLNNQAPMVCSRKKASAIYSSSYDKIWHIEGWGIHPSFAAELCRCVEITKEEYEQLKLALAETKEVANAGEEGPIISDEKITLEVLRDYKIKTMREFCGKAIINGVDVELSDGIEHFALEIEDQINLLSLQDLLHQGAEIIPYHETGKECKLYTAQEIRKILDKVSQHRVWHTTYFNALKVYLEKLTDITAINNIYYGYEIPEEYQTEALKYLLNK